MKQSVLNKKNGGKKGAKNIRNRKWDEPPSKPTMCGFPWIQYDFMGYNGIYWYLSNPGTWYMACLKIACSTLNEFVAYPLVNIQKAMENHNF